MDRKRFLEVFNVGELVESGSGLGVGRRKSVPLQIIAIQEDGIWFVSKGSTKAEKVKRNLSYEQLQHLVDDFHGMDPKKVTGSVNQVFKNHRLPPDHTNEGYFFGFARAFRDRTNPFRFQDGRSLPSDEESLKSSFTEGELFTVLVDKYERSRKARQECLKLFEARCQVCEFDFEKVYGEWGKGYIHVHHKEQISLKKKSHDVDPRKDLVPLCPNCHAMVHRNNAMLLPEELSKMMKEAKQMRVDKKTHASNKP